MKQAILNFASQFDYAPTIENRDRLRVYQAYIVAGVGGSGLAADLLKTYNPSLRLTVHKNYGLPENISDGTLVILNSYSGNTEETIDALNEASGRNLDVAIVSTGGKLIAWAQTAGAPYIQMPDVGIQPRAALGYNIRALTHLMGLEGDYQELAGLSHALRPGDYEEKGSKMAQALRGRVPIIYASSRNAALAYNWKIKCNETGKIPAFYNVFPELNHNEMTGFDVKAASKALSDNMAVIFLRDSEDHPRVQRRMDVTMEMYKERGLMVAEVSLEGEGRFHRMFASLILADWVAYHTAGSYGLEPEAVPMVEDFKKIL